MSGKGAKQTPDFQSIIQGINQKIKSSKKVESQGSKQVGAEVEEVSASTNDSTLQSIVHVEKFIANNWKKTIELSKSQKDSFNRAKKIKILERDAQIQQEKLRAKSGELDNRMAMAKFQGMNGR